MTTEDDKVSRCYRELAREEPPRQLDAAILAAGRRAADARPAPLPSGRRRWYFPLAAAAVIVLAVAVTVHVERQQRDSEVAEAGAAPAAPPAAAPAAPAAPERSARQDAASEMREAPGKKAVLQAEAPAGAVSGFAAASPEQWLQAIDDLKRQSRHDEAERELAEFRKRYPDYRIPEAILEKFEKR
jgi:TolA-binding protein